MVQPFWKTVWQFLQNYILTIPPNVFLDIYTNEKHFISMQNTAQGRLEKLF